MHDVRPAERKNRHNAEPEIDPIEELQTHGARGETAHLRTFRLQFLGSPAMRDQSVLLEGSLAAADLHATIQAATDVAGLTGITLPVARTNTPGMAQFG